ncbi:hypothetical protein CUB90_00460 [Clostridium sp. CT7]|nr:hypothetical protein CUB90_00460 [Clostridium sp. CT7]
MISNKVYTLKKSLEILSFIIGVSSVLLILNIFLRFIPFIKQGEFPLLIPIYVSPLGVIIAILSLIKNKNLIALCGLTINLVLILLEIFFIIIAPSVLLH